MYADRSHAGRVLADWLGAYAGRDDVVVLGLPRGGVVVAVEVASALVAPLDVLVVRKLGVPGSPELAMGAVASIGGQVVVVRNHEVLASALVPPEAFAAVERREAGEVATRRDLFRRAGGSLVLSGRTVLLVDDGLATGSTMRAAVASVRQAQPARVVVAVPVGAQQACHGLEREVDEVVCPLRPDPFRAVGQVYVDFTQATDDDVRRCMTVPARRPADQ